MVVRLLVCLFAALFWLPALAQNFPSRPITVVIPFPPGGTLDYILRTIQPKLEASLGQPIVIESRPGATGNIGNAYVAKSEPDGYTLVETATNIGVFPHIFSNLTYDPLKDLTVVGGVAETPTNCVVNPKGRFQTFTDLMKEAKANPGHVKFGSSGVGAPSHLVVELIGRRNNVKFAHVPYKGAQGAMNDLLGNFIDFVCTAISGSMQFTQQNQLRSIAMVSHNRSAALPDVPTVKELGFGDIDDWSRYVIFAPSKTPKPIIDRLSTVLAAALADPAVKEAYAKMSYQPITMTPAQVTALVHEQFDLWGPIVKDLNLKLE
jgi:tripartite-type tricarboxylate transporter receptor subunit TctC